MRNPTRALSLAELLVFICVFTIVVVGTLRFTSRARINQGNADRRTQLLMSAQEELTKLQMATTAELSEGTTMVKSEDSAVTITTSVLPHSTGLWEVSVTASRDTIEGMKPVTLATLVRGDRP